MEWKEVEYMIHFFNKDRALFKESKYAKISFSPKMELRPLLSDAAI